MCNQMQYPRQVWLLKNRPTGTGGFGSDVKDRDGIITPIHIVTGRLPLLVLKSLKRRLFVVLYAMAGSHDPSKVVPAAPRRMAAGQGGA